MRCDDDETERRGREEKEERRRVGSKKLEPHTEMRGKTLSWSKTVPNLDHFTPVAVNLLVFGSGFQALAGLPHDPQTLDLRGVASC